MRTAKLVGGLFLLLLAAGWLPSAASAENEATATVAPEVRSAIERMGAYLDGLASFRIRAHGISDEIDEDTGRRLQFGSTIEATLRRPDRLRLTHTTAGGRQEFFYDGARLTLHDAEPGYWAAFPVVGDVDTALERASEEIDVVPPLADFFYRAPQEILAEHAASGISLGPDLVDGVLCEHFAFSREDTDWQVWIEAGDRPVPRKLVITSTDLPGTPQFGVVITSFEPGVEAEDALFEFVPREGATRIEFLRVEPDDEAGEEPS